jgi:hypothetical protein
MVQSAIHTNRDRPKRPYMKIREMNIVVEDLAVPAGASLLSLGVVCKVRGSVAETAILHSATPVLRSIHDCLRSIHGLGASAITKTYIFESRCASCGPIVYRSSPLGFSALRFHEPTISDLALHLSRNGFLHTIFDRHRTGHFGADWNHACPESRPRWLTRVFRM